jgi:hypothetical protein
MKANEEMNKMAPVSFGALITGKIGLNFPHSFSLPGHRVCTFFKDHLN